MRYAINAAVPLALTAFLVVVAFPGDSSARTAAKLKSPTWAATPSGESCRPRWELLALGGGSYGGPNVFQGVWATLRLRYLNRVPFALEAGVMFPEGAVFTLMTDAWRARRWRIHFPDFGILYLVGDPRGFVRPDVKRRWDLTLGAGAEWEFVPRAWLTLDARFFLPDPTAVPFRYGGFTLPIYQDSARAVQIMIGIGKRLW